MAFNSTEIITSTLSNNYIEDRFLVPIVVFILTFLALKFFKFVIISKLKKLSQRTKTDIDDILIKIIDDIHWPFYVFMALYAAIKSSGVTGAINYFMDTAAFIAIVYYATCAIQTAIQFITQKLIKRRQREQKQIDTSVIDFLSGLLKGIMWLIAFLIILSNLGYDVTTLIAGIGIVGIAIAFALQNVLTDIFASFSIYFDKPFRVGDFIIIGKDLGTVKKIGIKTTRIQTLQGQELVVSNKDLTSTRINNYKKMQKRRVAFTFGVVYETPSIKLKKILKIMPAIFDKIELAELNRVHFKEFADFSLNFEVVYYVDTNDYNKYMDIQQDVNFAIKEAFEKEGIEFAYPTQTVFVNKQKS